MTITIEDIGKYLGQPIQDVMGRPAGKLVGLTAGAKSEVQSIQIARPEGEVTEHTVTSMKVIDGHPVLLQAWRVEAEDLKRENEVIQRRRQAIDLLLKDGDIDQSEYNQLSNGYEDIHKDIMTKRDSLVETLKNVEVKLEQQIRDLQTALTNDKILYTAAEIDAITYQTVTESLRTDLEISRKERKDIENTRESLHDIDILEILKEIPKTTNQSSAPNYIPDVVVIKMRESA